MPFQDWFTDEPLFWQTLTNILKTGNRGPAIKDLNYPHSTLGFDVIHELFASQFWELLFPGQLRCAKFVLIYFALRYCFSIVYY
jgi:hypothetical protein